MEGCGIALLGNGRRRMRHRIFISAGFSEPVGFRASPREQLNEKGSGERLRTASGAMDHHLNNNTPVNPEVLWGGGGGTQSCFFIMR